MLSNISYLLKKKSIKIGDLEENAGVSTGYLSRLAKEEKTKPSIEIVMRIAQCLNVSLDMLVRFDMTGLNATDEYLVNFLQKLTRYAMEGKAHWEKDSAFRLNQLAELGKSTHPLFDIVHTTKDGSYAVLSRFQSYNFDTRTRIHSDCFKCVIGFLDYVYLMNVQEEPNSGFKEFGKGINKAIEVWMITTDGERKFLCTTGKNQIISMSIRELYAAASENVSHPMVEGAVKAVIDCFMKEDNGFSEDTVQKEEETKA